MGHILTNALGLTTGRYLYMCVCVCVGIDVFLALFSKGGNHPLYMSH